MTTFAIIRTLMIGILAWLVLDKTIYLADHNFLFDGIIYLLIVGSSLITYLIILLKDKKEFKRTRKWTSYIPSGVGLLAVAGFFSQNMHLRSGIKV